MMADAEKARQYGTRTILFIDEIHRFNKAQQDAFLPYVERGAIRLIGATTENPSFEMISALLSRCRVYVLNPLERRGNRRLLRRALADAERGLGALRREAGRNVLRKIAAIPAATRAPPTTCWKSPPAVAADGQTRGSAEITDAIVHDALQRRVLLYDKSGEEHYNLISALHKSVRNSDPEPPYTGWPACWKPGKIRSTSPAAWCAWRSKTSVWPIRTPCQLAVAARDAVDFIGMPEGNLALAEAAVYLALAPKSNALYTAYWRGAARRRSHRRRNPCRFTCAMPPPRLMKQLGYGDGYQYAHDLDAKVADMQCLPDNLKDRVYYHPTAEGVEKRIRERLEELKRRRTAAKPTP